MGGEDEAGLPEHPSRVRRAKALGAISLGIVAVAGLVYLRPATQPAPSLPATAQSVQLDAVDFVDPSTGWVLADLDNFQFAVLGTTDAGRRWSPRLVQPSFMSGEYMQFFDRRHGVVVTAGGEPEVFSTQNAGVTWTRHTVYDVNAFAISASFVDPMHGWVLIGAGDGVPFNSPALVRTTDGGVTWTRLGATVPVPAQPFALSFSDQQHGWLDTVGAGPEAYTTSDAGATWQPVPLPAPAGGWPVPQGSYFIAIRPTLAGGLVASVVNSARVNGRSAAGSTVLYYPPLTVQTFDGGSAVVYVYSTFADSPTTAVTIASRPGQTQAANQTVMRSTDGGASWTVVAPPATGGTMGFASSLDWWWVGPGAMSTTLDGGLTWSPVRRGGLSQPVAGSLLVLDADHAWIGALVNGGASLYTTSDAGAHWTLVRLPSLRL